MRTKPVAGEIYHIVNRGVEKRSIFNNDQDRTRFVNGLYLFNDARPTVNTRFIEVGLRLVDERQKFVEILAFALMINHYHLLVRGLVDDGVTEFMRKIGTGYTKYFNTKYERVGPLFQGKYKAKLVEQDRHFNYVPQYIHFNPLEIFDKNWRDKGVLNTQGAKDFLLNYRWSSYLDYIGQDNFPWIIDRNFLGGFFEGSECYRIESLSSLEPEFFDQIEVGLR